MSWGDILKDFKSEKEIDELFSSAKELRKFLDYRLRRVRETIEFWDKVKNPSPKEQNFQKRLEYERKHIIGFMKNFIRVIDELETLEEIIEETVKRENKLD
jgi:hypothetical protein|tara:strand:+ start:1517 stop:1819 length:303 start_codon:yes stop_codon:yes gene_type:complete